MRKLFVAVAASFVAVGIGATSASSAPRAASAAAPSRYIVIASSKDDFGAALTAASRSSARVSLQAELAKVHAFVINTNQTVASALRKLGVKVVPDRVEPLVRPSLRAELGWIDLAKGNLSAVARRVAQQRNPFAPRTPSGTVFSGFAPDPAFDLGPPSPMWSIERVNGPAAWATNGGDDEVLVAVADTGLDYGHLELANKVIDVEDFTTTEEPNICSFFFGGPTDADLAADFGTSPDEDFNGHGSWIGGNIAGEVNDAGVNGLAPGVSLVSLKISQWCGSAYDSEIIAAFIWAAEHGIDVVSISFGGYLDRSDPFQDATYDLYVATIKYATSLGTTIVAAAGNEHTRIGKGGKVISHGILDVPPGGTDYFGLWEVPGGLPGVVDVSSSGNLVNAPSADCPPGSTGSETDARAWCKPTSDPHQPFGVGRENELAYYSNYGPRIDVAGPGGARKFNLPSIDGGGTEGWPFTGEDSYVSDNNPGDGSSSEDGFNAWEDFSITSNYALEIPCVIFDGSSADPDTDGYYGVPTQAGFPSDQCYSTIQGTSMATPHASAVLALIISAHPELRYDPKALIKFLKKNAVTPAKNLRNDTPPMSKNDTSDADRTAEPCPDGYCHLGGKAISASEAYGAGLVDAAKAVGATSSSKK